MVDPAVVNELTKTMHENAVVLVRSTAKPKWIDLIRKRRLEPTHRNSFLLGLPEYTFVTRQKYEKRSDRLYATAHRKQRESHRIPAEIAHIDKKRADRPGSVGMRDLSAQRPRRGPGARGAEKGPPRVSPWRASAYARENAPCWPAASCSPTDYTAVPSALGGLTSGFGTGPGVPPLPWPPANKGRSHPPARPSVPSGPHSARKRVSRAGTATACPPRAGGRGDRVRARTISTARLSGSPHLRLRPIQQVVCLCPYQKEDSSREGLPA